MVTNSKQQGQDVGSVAIKVQSVSKAFSAKPVLRDVSLNVSRGQAVCICGVNGVGKSTLIRIIAGLVRPDMGSVSIHHCDTAIEQDKARRHFGMVSHKSMVYPELTVRENLLFAAGLYGLRERTSKIEALLIRMKLDPYRYDQAGLLSRGLLQRLAIARALVHEPTVLLADEPFTGLDTEARANFTDIMQSFVRQGGALVMTTHDVANGLDCCERVVVLDKCHVLFDADSSQIDAGEFSRDYLSYARSRS